MIIEVADPSQIAAVRRIAVDLAKSQGADDVVAGRIAIVASELTSNLLKHAGRGHIVVDLYRDDSGSGVELLALDRGQGIADLDRAMSDGYSTAGTAGSGLGAIQRQSDQFVVFSRPEGTAAVARVALPPENTVTPGNNITLGVVHMPYPGEIVSGDAWAYGLSIHGPTLLAVDGSGHGAQAAAAAKVAVDVFRENLNESCVDLMDRIHRAMGHSRGGAGAVARLDAGAGLIRYVGVGNINGVFFSKDGAKHMVSHNGTLGLTAPRIREFTYAYTRPVTVVLHSDGLSARWDMASYPGLSMSHPSLIAGVLFRDHLRGRDDALVVALRAD